MLFLLVFHVLGVRPDEQQIRLRPRLLPGLERVTASLPIRGRWLHLEVRTSDRAEAPACRADGRPVEPVAGEWLIPHNDVDVGVEIELCR
jgi:cellobiose phosphorylase